MPHLDPALPTLAELTRMAEARWRQDGLQACWGLIAELAWLAPARCDELLRRWPDPVLQRLRRRFDADYEGGGDVTDLAWFPAWLLTEQPALATWLGQAQPGLATAPERGLRALLVREGLHYTALKPDVDAINAFAKTLLE